MQVVHIQFPFVITDDGQQIKIGDIDGHPKVGSNLVGTSDGYYEVVANASDSDCVNGVCPVR